MGIGPLRSIYETLDGDVWLGGLGEHGIALYRDGVYRVFNEADGYTGGGVFSIGESADGRILAGGRNSIMAFDGGKWTCLQRDFSTVRSFCLGRDGVLWIASGTGIHRYYEGSWTTNTVEDGLPNTGAFSVIEDNNGSIWAGTINGLSLYHPEADTYAPETIVLDTENLSKTPPGGEVRIIYSGLDKWKQTKKERLQFSSRLDGGTWSPFQNRNMAVFNNLEYGDHVFEVRARDVNMNIDREPAKFEFTVLSPWYMERGFQIVAVIGGSIIVFLIGLAVFRHVALEKLVVLRTEDLMEANIQLKQKIGELVEAEKRLKSEHSELELMFRREQLLSKTASFLNSSVDFYSTLDQLIEMVAKATDVSSLSLFNLETENRRAVLINRWTSPSCIPTILDFPEVRFEDIPQCVSLLLQGKSLVTSAPSELEEMDRLFWESRNVIAMIAIPICSVERAMAALCFCRSSPYKWQSGEQEMFTTIADIIANAWQRYNHQQARIEADKKQSEAIRMAERAGSLASIGVMAAGIIHEINQPLNAIGITAESVMMWDDDCRGILPAKFRERLGKLSGNVARIDEIIHHMRSFWVSPADVINETIDLAMSIRNALSLVRRQLGSHGISLEIKTPPEVLLISGNPIYLEQVMINLVMNAMHALDHSNTEDRRIVIELSGDGQKARIEVGDNGTGLPEASIEDLFDPFFSTKKPGEGTGLGLAIVKRFMERLGGTVEARNNDMGGATFVLVLPLLNIPETVSETDENTAG